MSYPMKKIYLTTHSTLGETVLKNLIRMHPFISWWGVKCHSGQLSNFWVSVLNLFSDQPSSWVAISKDFILIKQTWFLFFPSVQLISLPLSTLPLSPQHFWIKKIIFLFLLSFLSSFHPSSFHKVMDIILDSRDRKISKTGFAIFSF